MPGHRRPLVLVPQHFGCLVFDRRTAHYLAFNHEATGILLRLAVAGIDGVMANLAEDEQAEVLALVDDLYARRFFRLDGQFDVEVRVVDVPEDHLVGPLVVHLEIIAACNLTCSHCFAGELPRNENPLSVAEMASLFAELSRLGSFRLGVTGGEPLLRKDLLEILDAALEVGLYPSLTTNALLIDETIARELGKRPDVWLTASLEGPDAATNDPIRGAGTFDAVLEKLALLRRHAAFALSFTITQPNAHRVRDCADLARRVGARAAVFRPLYPTGVALDHMELMPSLEQYAGALAELAELNEGIQVAQTPATCGAGQTLCSISVQGDVNPCSFMGREFETGNIRIQPFEAIWRQGQAMRRMRSDGHGGGCRVRSLRLGGAVDAPDPWLTAHEQGGCYHPSTNLELTSRLALPLIGGGVTMLPERLNWITEAFEPEGDPMVLAHIASELAAEGNLEGAATVYDRAFGVAPEIDTIRAARASVLDRLEIHEQGLVFRYVPGGPVLIGCREGERDEQPLHPVWLSPFWLTETPLSWVDYCRLQGWPAPPRGRLDGAPIEYHITLCLNYSYIQGNDPGEPQGRYSYRAKPVLGVGWHEADALAKKLSGKEVAYGLPTEAQWEKAARGGLIGARYPWGDEPPTRDRCDFDNMYGWQIGEMKSRPANDYGLYAMSGCVWEWTADWYDRDYYRSSETHDPTGPAKGEEKVLRGGSWADCGTVVTATYRMSHGAKPWNEDVVRTPTIGVRLCRVRVG